MNLKVSLLISIAMSVFACFSCPDAQAQGYSYARRGTMPTGTQSSAIRQTRPRFVAQSVNTSQLSYIPNTSSPDGWRNGLPPVRTDSFVKEAKQHANHIYGDEGTTGLPPYMGYSKVHRINTGIMDDRDLGLTTGHGSYLPDAVGADEFTGNEWDQSGFRNRHASDGFPDGLPVMTGSGAGPGDNGSQNLPPPPGPGYQPAYTCEGFVGYYSPEEIELAQTDFPAAFDHFVHSDRYTGSILNADLILRLQMGRPGY